LTKLTGRLSQKLELSKRVLGVEHPSTLTSMVSLASFLSSQKQYEEAERMHQQALQLREKVLGLEHPDTVTNVWYFAYLLHG
jgi:hypothetical protein